MITLYRVRHGHSEANALGVRPGHLPYPLTDLGKEEARLTGDRLKQRQLDAIYASDSVRTMETAQHILEHQSCPLLFDRRLRDIEQGEFLGLTNKEIQERFKEVLPLLKEDFMDARRPGGETFSELTERAWSCVQDIVTTWEDNDTAEIAVVTHGGVVTMIVYEAIGEVTLKIPGNASVTTLEYNPITKSWKLLEMDSVSHLSDLPEQPITFLPGKSDRLRKESS